MELISLGGPDTGNGQLGTLLCTLITTVRESANMQVQLQGVGSVRSSETRVVEGGDGSISSIVQRSLDHALHSHIGRKEAAEGG